MKNNTIRPECQEIDEKCRKEQVDKGGVPSRG